MPQRFHAYSADTFLDGDGEFVYWEDYESLRAERDALLPLARFVAHLVESRLETRQSFDRTCFADNEVELAVEYLGLKEDHLAAALTILNRELLDA